MSVINQMLKDLDKRQAPEFAATAMPSATTASPASKKLLTGFLLAIVVLNALAVYLWYQAQQGVVSSAVATPMSAGENAGKAVPQVTAVQPAPVTPSDATPVANGTGDNPDKTQADATVAAKSIPVVDTAAESEKIKTKSDQVAHKSERLPTAEKTNEIPALSNAAASASIHAPLNKTPDAQVANVQQTSVQVSAGKPSLSITRHQASAAQLAQQKMDQAEQALARNDGKRAEQLLEDVLLLQPEHLAARKQLAALWFGRQAYQAALNTLSQGLALVPQYSEFRIMQARIYLKLGDSESAYAVLSPVPEQADTDYLAMFAGIAQQLAHFNEAGRAYQRLSERQPLQAKWWLGLAIAEDSASDFQAALQHYRTALANGGLAEDARQFARQRLQALGE